MKTEASKADKTLIENLVKELIKQNILINKKTPKVLILLKYWGMSIKHHKHQQIKVYLIHQK